MRRAIFLVALLLAMSIPNVQAEGEEGVLFTWIGSASTVELKGEWDWDQTIVMTESGGIWSTTVDLEDGLYCYKFIVDDDYIFDQEVLSGGGYQQGLNDAGLYEKQPEQDCCQRGFLPSKRNLGSA